ncbi:hypothetical protein L596_023571 [Steinernema carpocapsae]|uniref:Peptidase S54 rhomboid domain-containing protein n=1 Tax=Steinernema carpocapsae TaxID=34508 RepID=A0A4V5ZZG4_STECR|nr:hypothetical protein L596_023571 [Steinernema carpocapsae]
MGLSKEARKLQLETIVDVVEDCGNNGHVTTRQLSMLSNKIAERVPLTPLQADRIDSLMQQAESQIFSAEDIEEELDSAAIQETCFNRVLYKIGQCVFPRSQLSNYRSYIYAYRCWPPPLFCPLAITLAIVLYVMVSFEHFQTVAIRPCNAHYVYPYITNMFFHTSLSHLISNLVILFFCCIKELVHHYRIIVIFFLSGIGSALVYVTFAKDDIPSVGMSGAIYGLLAVHISDIFLNWREMPLRFLRLLIIFGFLVMANFDLIFGESSIYDSNVSHFSHIGGFLFGLPLGVVFLRNLEARSYDTVARTACSVLLPFFFVLGMVLNLFRSVRICSHLEEEKSKTLTEILMKSV